MKPRILAIMGSGETGSAMSKVHRDLFSRLGHDATGAVIDTPYGFQENADDITARIVEYFRDTIGRPMRLASFRSRDIHPLATSTALARIREADYVLAGPGSPSYVLRQWAGGYIPNALADKLANGGVVTLASAAALTLGVVTVPVYEIYKVGADPVWLDGLDLLGPATGLRAAVVPHYDNNEGGNHDTRFCYLGERRLTVLEEMLPPDTFVLGVDGHTALVFDLDRRTATVSGLGGVTVRAAGRSRVFPSGSVVDIDALADTARELREVRGPGADGGTAVADNPLSPEAVDADPDDPAGAAEGAFVAALAERDVSGAVANVLELDASLEARLRRGEDSPDLDGDRALYRSMLVRLGEAAATGANDPRVALAPLVDALLELRRMARDAREWGLADLIRDQLNAAGVEVRDAEDGSTWSLEERVAR